MQVVILASGRGTRMRELTDTTPKPMLLVAGKSLLEHKLDALPDGVTDIVFIVGYKAEKIRDYFGSSWKGRGVSYVDQPGLDGTAAAVWLAAPFLKDRFLVLMGDDLYATADMQACIDIPDWSVLVKKTEHMAAGGKMVTDDKERLIAIEEGDHTGTPGIMNTNMFVLDARLFEYPMVPKSAESSEYGLPQSVLAASLASGIPLTTVEATDWFQVTSPEDLVLAEKHLGLSVE